MRESRYCLGVAVALAALAGCSQPTGSAGSADQASQSASGTRDSAAPETVTNERTELALENDSGTYRIPVLINNTITLKFLIDSGASDVSIPADVASTLVRSGTITQDDFIGNATFQLADGSTVPSAMFRIRSLKIGNLELQNVTASLANANSPLLLGQSFLSRLTSWSIDNSRHVLVLNANPGSALAPLAPPPSTTDVASVANAPTDDQSTNEVSTATVPPNPNTSAEASTVHDRTLAFFSAWSGSDAESAENVRPYFASTVNFYGGMLGIDTLMASELKFAQRWPVRTYTVQEPFSINCQDDHTCLVQGLTAWDASNPSTGLHSTGVAQFALVFRDGLIVAENERVLQRRLGQ